MRSETEIREAIDLMLDALATCGLEIHVRRQLTSAVAALKWALGGDCEVVSIGRTLDECRELLSAVEG